MITPMRRPAAAVWLLLLTALLTCCADENELPAPLPSLTPYPPDLYIGLSEAASPLAAIVSTVYETETGRTAPKFIMASDENLLNDLEQGALKAVLIHHLPAGSQNWFSPIALDGVVIITHPEVAVNDLSASQLQRIFGGSINNWVDLGGPDLPIRVYSRESGTGSWATLQERVLKNVPLSGLAQIAPSDEFMKEQVNLNPGAIGYTMLGDTDNLRTVLFEGKAATPDSVEEQLYPLTTPIYFVSPAEPEGNLRDFLAWLQSPSGQSVLSDKYGQVR
jgi:ABC-type phosphate transport system substrate-binding protein